MRSGGAGGAGRAEPRAGSPPRPREPPTTEGAKRGRDGSARTAALERKDSRISVRSQPASVASGAQASGASARARERSERASAGAGARKEKCVKTLVYKGILYYPTLKSRCGITVPHLFTAKTVQFRDQKICNLCRGES